MNLVDQIKAELAECEIPVEKWNNIIDFCIAEEQAGDDGLWWRDALVLCLDELYAEKCGDGDWMYSDY